MLKIRSAHHRSICRSHMGSGCGDRREVLRHARSQARHCCSWTASPPRGKA